MNDLIIAKTREKAEQIATNMNLEIWDVELVKEAGSLILRITAESAEGITIEQCGDLSIAIGEWLDIEDPIEEDYFLEVTSPGAERELKQDKDIQESVGRYVNIKTYAKVDGVKEFEGELLSYENNVVVVKVNLKGRFKEFSIDKKQISKIRWAIKF